MNLADRIPKRGVSKDDKFWQVCYTNLNSFRVFTGRE